MMSALDISTSALVAQRVRLDAVSSNLANMSSLHPQRERRDAAVPGEVCDFSDGRHDLPPSKVPRA